MKSIIKNKVLFASYLSLFTSFGTLFCCALPSLLVAIGMGATFAGLIGIVPQLVWLSENKILIFSLSGILILISSILIYLNRSASCPIDPEQAKACASSRKWSIRIVILSSVFWFFGFVFAFLVPLFFI
ncbi:MAG: hypothetical protein OXC37_04520 [Bdellovibrionaceae bacterium]|nr:hypothetical protein [Pseudobdellovibrionaceae bacterium]